LVICDDRWHPAATIRAGLKPLEDQHSFDWIENAADWSAERMAEYPVVLLTKSNNISSTDESPWVTSEVEDAFRSYVRGGKGLLVIHSGSAGYTDTRVLRGLLGGVFEHHPPQCDVTVKPHVGHPLTAGADSFTVRDEHYLMAFNDQQADVFMTTVSEHGEQPGGWTRTEGDGRVCMLTPGHNLHVWHNPAYQRLIRNALLWVGDS
jgi:type 1 glutamine amidotransferase